MIQIICKQCKKEKWVRPCQKDTAQFCCRVCHNQWMSENIRGENHPLWKKRVILICKQCGNKFKVVSNRERKAKFCCRKCHNQWRSENKAGENSCYWKEKEIIICKQCGKEFKVVPSQKDKAKFCSRKCMGLWMSDNRKGDNSSAWKGGKHTNKCEVCNKEFEVFLHREDTARFCSKECLGKWTSENLKGENHHNWKGGVTTLQNLIRTSKKYRELHKTLLKKVNYTCQLSQEMGVDLNVHHIKGFARILEENNITIYEQVENCVELWDEKNIIVLSEEWHMGVKTDNPNAFHRIYGTKNFTEEDFYEWFEEFRITK